MLHRTNTYICAFCLLAKRNNSTEYDRHVQEPVQYRSQHVLAIMVRQVVNGGLAHRPKARLGGVLWRFLCRGRRTRLRHCALSTKSGDRNRWLSPKSGRHARTGRSWFDGGLAVVQHELVVLDAIMSVAKFERLQIAFGEFAHRANQATVERQ